MSNVRDRVLFNAVRASRAVDAGYRLFRRGRSFSILALTDERFLAHQNARFYEANALYIEGAHGQIAGLFDWERVAIERFFPKPPARILVGGAGGGREVAALADMGYDVVAFEPVDRLCAAMRRRFSGHAGVRVFCASYQDLPLLGRPDAGSPVPTSVDDLGPFNAAILGWGSISHVRGAARRISALRQITNVCPGPILLSYFGRLEPTQPEPAALARARKQFNVEVGDWFEPTQGYLHEFTPSEIEDLARSVSRGCVTSGSQRSDLPAGFPHAVFLSQAEPPRGA